jgi:nitrous oxidase accessory protein NosD
MTTSVATSHVRLRLVICSTAALLAFSAALVFGIPPANASHVSCGQVITTDTTLDSDLVNCPADGVVIGAGGITLDLGGHTIDGISNGDGVNNAAGHDGVVVKNGSIEQFFRGVEVRSTSANVVERVTVTDSGLGFVFFDTDDSTISKSATSDVSSGVQLAGESDRNLVEKSSLSGTANGIAMLPSDIPPSPQDNIVSKNLISGFQFGVVVFAGTGAIVERNTILGVVDADSTVLNAGVLVGATNTQVRRNTISGSEAGIRISPGVGSVITRNSTVDNSIDGISVAPQSSNITIERNVSSGNGDDGIDVDTPSATITRNVANGNGDYGIEAVPGVTDGGGNKASGNGNLAQCTGVACS